MKDVVKRGSLRRGKGLMFKKLFISIARQFGFFPQTWLISDQHFFHYNIIGYCDRPFSSTEEMNKELVKRYNSLVRKQDGVIFCGDVGFKSAKRTVDTVKLLNGTKYLVKGNHDGQLIKYLRDTETELFGWVKDHHTIDYKGVKLHITHRPTNDIGDADALVYGHTHNKTAELKVNSVCVCVEHWDYYPVNIEKVIDIIKQNMPASV